MSEMTLMRAGLALGTWLRQQAGIGSVVAARVTRAGIDVWHVEVVAQCSAADLSDALGHIHAALPPDLGIEMTVSPAHPVAAGLAATVEVRLIADSFADMLLSPGSVDWDEGDPDEDDPAA